MMWPEIGKTVRKAMDGWSAAARFVVCVATLTAAAVVVLLVCSL
ncbi:hypothetical protein [Nocardia brasiliensis]|nr:hypothetical protein [Nocardia brasiliensis]